MANSARQKRQSLKKEAIRAIGVSMLILLCLTMLLGFRFFVYSGLRYNKNKLDAIGAFAVAEIDRDYVLQLLETTKEVYYSIPEEVRSDPFTDEFKDYTRPYLDDRYNEARQVLINCRETTGITNICIGFYDKEYERYVIALDGDLKEYYYIMGQYISNENGYLENYKKINRIMNSKWQISIAHTGLMGFAATDYIAIKGDDGEVLGIVEIDTVFGEFKDDIVLFVLLFIPALLLLFLFFLVFISKAIDKRILSPVRNLALAAKDYTSRDKVNESENSSFFRKINLESSDEISELRDSMAEMENDVNRSMKEIRRASAEKEHIAAEMEIASDIQRSALPKTFPDRPEFDLYAQMDPAKEVAGDFYDFFMIDGDHMAMIIADVSGKGVPAALFMMKGKEILKNRAMQGGKPSEILAFANDELAKDNDNAMFITIWLGILEISTGVITASNAGHEYPFIGGADRFFGKFEEPHGLMCGAMEGMEYEDYRLKIPKGGGLFVYTDGVAEAMNSKDEYFGLEKIGVSLNSHRGASAKEYIDFMRKDIDDFAAGLEQYDDITMLCLLLR